MFKSLILIVEGWTSYIFMSHRKSNAGHFFLSGNSKKSRFIHMVYPKLTFLVSGFQLE